MSIDFDAAAIEQLRRHSYLPASEVARLGGTDDQGLAPGWMAMLEQVLPLAADRAQPPVSNYRVGSAALGQRDAQHGAPSLYLGANLEVHGLPLNASMHAEQAATAHAWSRGEQGVLAVAASAPPCGHCRQFLCELGDPADLAIVVPGDEPHTLEDLLPAAFGPDQLGVSTHWMKTPFVGPGEGSEAAAQAIAAASFAPYSGVRAAVVLTLSSGAWVGGASVESVAYNPSLGPMAMALSQLALREPEQSAGSIEAAVLVESEGPISHFAASEQVLRAVAPELSLSRIALDDGTR